MKKRLYLGILAVAATAALTAVGSLALFTAADPDGATSSDFTAGTVTFGTAFSRLGNITDVAPGDSGDQTYSIQYTGNLDAWLGLTTNTTGTLFNCDAGNPGSDFTVTITDEKNVTYANTGTNQVVVNAAGDTKPVAPNYTKTFTVHWSLDRAAGNTCQGKTASVQLTLKAVQAKNNNPTGNAPTDWN